MPTDPNITPAPDLNEAQTVIINSENNEPSINLIDRRIKYRLRADWISDAAKSPTARYRLRNRRDGRCYCCPRPARGWVRCPRCRKVASSAAKRRGAADPGRSAEKNRLRRARYAAWRGRGYSVAESRTYSEAQHWVMNAPSPAPVIKREKMPRLLRLFLK